MRTLKFHEKKLMKKVDLFHWKKENSREVEVMRRYHIQNREDYAKLRAVVLRGGPVLGWCRWLCPRKCGCVSCVSLSCVFPVFVCVCVWVFVRV